MTNRWKLRVSEGRSNVYIDYPEREQLHEGEAWVIGESILFGHWACRRVVDRREKVPE